MIGRLLIGAQRRHMDGVASTPRKVWPKAIEKSPCY